jgi:G3E family GTPase
MHNHTSKYTITLQGVLSFAGQPKKFVFQGVHEHIDCDASNHTWPDAEEHATTTTATATTTTPTATAVTDIPYQSRVSKIVFIGRDLDRDMIEKGLRDALV